MKKSEVGFHWDFNEGNIFLSRFVFSTKVFEVIHEIGQSSVLIDLKTKIPSGMERKGK